VTRHGGGEPSTGGPCIPYGRGTRMLTLDELCSWLNITERHARKLVERDAIPYRKVGHLLRFPEAEVDDWCRPIPKSSAISASPVIKHRQSQTYPRSRRAVLPKSLIE
jgi:excisionase family DNA binding protein